MPKRYTKEEIDRFHDYKLYVPTRTIWLGSESVDSDQESGTDAIMAERLIMNISILDSISTEPITILMNNIGGFVPHGMAIYDAIKCCRSKVTIKVFGQAYSMGSVILQAADKRIMAPNAQQMAHYGTLEVSGHAKTVEKTMQACVRDNKWMERMYLEKMKRKNPGYTLEKLKNLLDHDTFLTARESVAMGLADAIMSTKELK